MRYFNLFVILAIFGSGNGYTDSYVIDAPSTGVEIGLGWDAKRNRLVPSRCIAFAPIQEGGQLATVDVSEINDSSELQKHLGVSASAQISGLVGSASASASFVQDVHITSTRTNFAVRASVTNGVTFIGPSKPPNLRRFAFSATQPVTTAIGTIQPDPDSATNQYVQLAPWLKQVRADPSQKGQLGKFHQLCGDGFVSAIYSGVELFTVISFDQTKTTKGVNMSAEVKASYGVGAGSAKFNQDTQQAFQTANTSMHFVQRGGAGGSLPSSREDLARKLNEIAREAMDAPEFFDIEITPYTDLPGWTYGPLHPGGKYTDAIVERYLQLKTIYRDLDDVIEQGTTRYTMCFSKANYQNLQDRIARTLALLEKTQAHVVKNDWEKTAQNFYIDNFRKLGVGTPVAAVQALRASPDEPDDKILAVSEDKISLVDWLDVNMSVAYLRTLMPPLKDEANLPNCDDPHKAAYQQAVIDQYIEPINKRVCAVSISDPDCLSNQAMAVLKSQVKYPSKKDFEADAEGYLCIGGFGPTQRCLAGLSKDKVFQLTSDLDKAAIVKLESAGSVGQVKLLVKLTSVNGDDVQELRVADGGAEPKYKGIRRLSVPTGNKPEIIWQTVKIPHSDQSGLLATNSSNKFGKKTMQDCLLWEPWSDNALIFPNKCQPGSKSAPNYSWILYSAEELAE